MKKGEAWAVLGRSGLFWAVLACPGAFCAFLGRPGLFWAILGCSGLSWAALGCSGLFWAVLGCSRLLWAVLGHCGLFWAVLACSQFILLPFLYFAQERYGCINQSNQVSCVSSGYLFLCGRATPHSRCVVSPEGQTRQHTVLVREGPLCAGRLFICLPRKIYA